VNPLNTEVLTTEFFLFHFYSLSLLKIQQIYMFNDLTNKWLQESRGVILQQQNLYLKQKNNWLPKVKFLTKNWQKLVLNSQLCFSHLCLLYYFSLSFKLGERVLTLPSHIVFVNRCDRVGRKLASESRLDPDWLGSRLDYCFLAGQLGKVGLHTSVSYLQRWISNKYFLMGFW